MENASKALLMAGGILIALLIIGALMLMFNQIGDYEKAQSSNEKNSQLVQFNNEFVKYTEDKGITGADVISLINKVIDYNKKAQKGGVTNSVNYDIKISITIKNLNSFNNKYSYNDTSYQLFASDTYVIGNEADANSATNKLKDALNNCRSAESGLSTEYLKELSGVYNPNESEQVNIKNIKAKLLEIDSAQGTNKYTNWNKNMQPTLDVIKNYRQYSEFKSSTFVVSQDPVYENGQIKELYFKFSK